MPAPPNTSPATAIDLTERPVDRTIDVTALGGADLWYRYTAAAGEFLVGIAALAAPSSTYPLLSVYSDAGITLYLDIATHKRVQVPVTPATAYYLQISAVPGGSTSVHLTLGIAPNVATGMWALAIPDDTSGFPMVIHSPIDGAVLQTRPFPAGETAHVLPSGISLWHDTDVTTAVRLYDSALTLQGSPAWTFASTPPMSSNRLDRFYVGDSGIGGGPARLTTISSTGTLGATTWTLPFTGMTAVGINRAETIAYLVGQVSALDSQIRRWDLVHSVYLTPLAAAVTNYIVMNPLLVLDDDTVIIGYYKAAAPKDSVVRRYAPDGTLLQTYALGAVKLDHLTHNTSDTSFWVWLHLQGPSSGLSRFQQIRVSDGAILTTFDAAQYEGGAYQGTGTPTEPFGHSFSCPFTLVPPLAPYGEDGGGGGEPPAPGDTDVRLIRRLRRAPHVAHENQRVFYRKFELDLERGIGAPTAPGDQPTLTLRISRDGGQTWSLPMTLQAGALGAFSTRAIAWRLGHARDAVFEVTTSDPVAWSLVQAWLDLEAGTN